MKSGRKSLQQNTATEIAAVGGVGVAGMDAVFWRGSGLRTDGSQVLVDWLAVGLWVGSVALDRVAVAALVARFAGCSHCPATGCGVAPEDPCPPCQIGVGLLIGSTVKAASYASNEGSKLRR